MNPTRRHTLGHSLIELVTAMAVSSVLLALMLGFVGAAMGSLDRDRSRGEAIARARNILSLMRADLASVCRSSATTNLVIEADGCGCRLALLVTRPGDGPDVCAVGYRIMGNNASGPARLVRDFTTAGATLEMLRRGEDPLASDRFGSQETIATGLRNLRFAPEPRDRFPGHVAFTTNLPWAIDVTLSVAANERSSAVELHCRLPLQ